MRKLYSIIAIIVICCIPLGGCAFGPQSEPNTATTQSQVAKPKSEKPKTIDPDEYTGLYSRDYDADNWLGVCDSGSENGCKYEITLTNKNITVHYTNSAGTSMVWYGSVSLTDITEEYDSMEHVYKIVSTLDSNFENLSGTSTAMFGYEGYHKEFKFYHPKGGGNKYIAMQVPDGSEDAIFDTTNANISFVTKDAV